MLRSVFATLFARLWHSSRERNSWSLTFDLVVGTVKEAFRSAPPSVRLIKRFVGESGANVPVPPRVASCEPVVIPPLRAFPGQEPIKAEWITHPEVVVKRYDSAARLILYLYVVFSLFTSFA